MKIINLFLLIFRNNIFKSDEYIKTLPGISEPLNFFDPLKLSNNKEKYIIDFYHKAEIKHGRIAMLSIFGILTQELIFNIPAIYQYNLIPSNLQITMLLLYISIIESIDLIKNYKLENNYLILNPIEINSNITKELNHGRLAMILSIIILFNEITKRETLYDILFYKNRLVGICA